MPTAEPMFSNEEIRNLEREYGSAFIIPVSGGFRGLNEQFFSELYRRHHYVLFEPDEKRFFQYEAETGLWQHITEEKLKDEIADFSRSFIHADHFFDALSKVDHSFRGKVMKILKGEIEKRGAFQKRHEGYRVHCANCVLEFDFGIMNWVSRPFDPEDYSRNRTEIPYIPEAQASRFLGELIQPAMNEEDAKILQLYIGQCLLGDNPSQRFLLITGTAGGGKSTLVNVIEQLVTRENCTELRLEHMHGRFENSRLIGKTLLTGKDVKAGFLDSKGAPMLKALTGKDILTTEFKHSNSTIDIVGNYNVIITSNATLQVRLENDAPAWKRRILWVKYENPPPVVPIENFDQLLIREEGSGILNFALDGARELLS